MVDLVERLTQSARLDTELEQRNLDELLLGVNDQESLLERLGTDQDLWDKLIVYSLERRFGWSESTGFATLMRSGNEGEDELAIAERAKRKIIESLDHLLHLLKSLPLCSPALHAFVKAAPASNKPVVRQRAYLHVFDWVMRHGSNSSSSLEASIDEVQGTLQQMITLGLTDVWSATRKACAEKLCSMACLLSLKQLEILFVHIISTYTHAAHEGDGTKWKEQEGCLLGVNAIVKQFCWLHEDAGDGSLIKHSIRFGASIFPCLPEFISDHLKGLLFHALAHPQVSVREIAVKTFSSYLQRSTMQESIVCLENVMNKLSGLPVLVEPFLVDNEANSFRKQRSYRLAKSSSESEATGTDLSLAWQKLTAWSSMGTHQHTDRMVLLEACEAQGLLSLCQDLLNSLPSEHILVQWPVLFPTMNVYLAHDASTVRQACSSLFLCVMAKTDEDSPMLQRLVLQSMATSKQGGGDSTPLLRSCSADSSETQKQANHDEKKQLFFDDHSVAPSDRPRISGPSKSFSMPEVTSSQTFPGLSSQHKAGGIGAEKMGLPLLPKNQDVAQECEVSQKVLCSSWEWHEGRLLAYELLLGHLTKEHTIKMFLCDPSCAAQSLQKTPDAGHFKRTSFSNFNALMKGTVSPFRSASPDSSQWKGGTMSPLSPLTLTQPRKMSGSLNGSPVKRFDGPSLLDKLKRCDTQVEAGVPPCTEDGALPRTDSVVGYLQFEPIAIVLERIFYEVLHCVGDVRWELRRMALQVLPMLTQVFLWHDAAMLKDLWLKCMPKESTPYCGNDHPYGYAAALSIKEALRCTLEWHDFVQTCPSEMVTGCEARVAGIMECVVSALPKLLVPIENLYLQKQPLKARALGVELVMLIHCRLPDVAAVRQNEQVSSLTQWLASLYSSAHDSTDSSPYKMKEEDTSLIISASTPDSARRTTTKRAAENVERALIKVLCPMLPDFVSTLDFSQMMQLLPVLVRYMERYIEDIEVELPLVDAMHRIFSLPLSCWVPAITKHAEHEAVNARLSPVNEEARAQTRLPSADIYPTIPLDNQAYYVAAACDLCVGALLVLVEAPSTEIVLLRGVMTVLTQVTKLVGDGRYLQSICESLSTRLKVPLLTPEKQKQSPQHLLILSNEISEDLASPKAQAGVHQTKASSLLHREDNCVEKLKKWEDDGVLALQPGSNGSYVSSESERDSLRRLSKARLSVGDLTVDVAATAKTDWTAGNMGNGEEEEEEGSDWDDWSEDEDFPSVEGEISIFLTCLQEAGSEWGGCASHTQQHIARMLRLSRRDDRGWGSCMMSLSSAVRGLVQHLMGANRVV